MANSKIIPQYLIPPEIIKSIVIRTEEDLIALGSENLTEFKRYWEKEKLRNVDQINAVYLQTEMLRGKTTEDMKRMADKYENPEFYEIGFTGEHYTNQTAPKEIDSRGREMGATTFNVCGWCKYSGGRKLGSCNVNVTCALAPEVFNGGELHFDTPCIVANGTQRLLEACQERLKSKLTGLLERSIMIDEYLEVIETARGKAIKKPLFAPLRSADWFKVGDEVVVVEEHRLREDQIAEVYKDSDSSQKQEVDILDGRVELETKDRSGFGVRMFRCAPSLMHKWEAEYFKANPDYLELYTKASIDIYGTDRYRLVGIFGAKSRSW